MRRLTGILCLMVLVAALVLLFRSAMHDAPQPGYTPGAGPENPAASEVRRSSITAFERNDADRVEAARKRSENEVHTLFQKAGLPYPADELFIRTFKREGELEIWARMKNEQFRKIAIYEITADSGGPGPKRREGDGQVPEGFYEVDRFNPKSNFHLSLGLNYPNASDRILSDQDRPGTDIFIHGNAVSIGCMPLGDDRMEEVYLMALDTKKRPIHVHNFPSRMDGDDWMLWRNEQTGSNPKLAAFWDQLQPAYDAFEASRLLPEIKVLPDGSYQIQKAAASSNF